MAEGGSVNLAKTKTCGTSKMCVRKTTSVLLFLWYKYDYTLACEDKLEDEDKKALDELTDNKGCKKMVGNNAGGCIETFNKNQKGRYVEICCCDGDK